VSNKLADPITKNYHEIRSKPVRESKKLNIYQRRYLQERIDGLRYKGDFEEPKEPAAVKQARKVVDGWDRHVTSLKRAYERKRGEKFAEARKLLNFGTPAEALAAVEALEALS
jgi:hypothetical protein